MNNMDYFNELENYCIHGPMQYDAKGLYGKKNCILDFKVLLDQNRDSHFVTTCNFQVALKMLGGESKDVQVHRFLHRDCGWLEILIVSSTAPDAIKNIAGDIVCSILEYSVLI